jgi:hypothetical protein
MENTIRVGAVLDASQITAATAASDRSLFFSRSQLRGRGWSHAAMQLFLVPDDLCPHPTLPGVTLTFYLIERVRDVELSAKWQAWRWASPKRRLQIECECA